ncbi:hypothetical protein MBM_09815 [Drepanopeziza brunnea f. sp. 'multigermtubi' MB_m1]|uniref:Uncharacterized protein n=1 Tax=Marssonina brunnea f. sp. multigermtubi (strain MB_m1) TaxID=1072389 RepID=K1WGQ2_MARBU|nr:uncharacterized protein MBM_09815 [Drepanopeziza brunnea f. sp. 'multigermtubi' MB_m1]EKD12031.1 hypothetical protein MBM_09815 [Drepanopeziza brunnea f. sp. 'multigermtubi' MB_m1]
MTSERTPAITITIAIAIAIAIAIGGGDGMIAVLILQASLQRAFAAATSPNSLDWIVYSDQLGRAGLRFLGSLDIGYGLMNGGDAGGGGLRARTVSTLLHRPWTGRLATRDRIREEEEEEGCGPSGRRDGGDDGDDADARAKESCTQTSFLIFGNLKPSLSSRAGQPSLLLFSSYSVSAPTHLLIAACLFVSPRAPSSPRVSSPDLCVHRSLACRLILWDAKRLVRGLVGSFEEQGARIRDDTVRYCSNTVVPYCNTRCPLADLTSHALLRAGHRPQTDRQHACMDAKERKKASKQARQQVLVVVVAVVVVVSTVVVSTVVQSTTLYFSSPPTTNHHHHPTGPCDTLLHDQSALTLSHISHVPQMSALRGDGDGGGGGGGGGGWWWPSVTPVVDRCPAQPSPAQPRPAPPSPVQLSSAQLSLAQLARPLGSNHFRTREPPKGQQLVHLKKPRPAPAPSPSPAPARPPLPLSFLILPYGTATAAGDFLRGPPATHRHAAPVCHGRVRRSCGGGRLEKGTLRHVGSIEEARAAGLQACKPVIAGRDPPLKLCSGMRGVLLATAGCCWLLLATAAGCWVTGDLLRLARSGKRERCDGKPIRGIGKNRNTNRFCCWYYVMLYMMRYRVTKWRFRRGASVHTKARTKKRGRTRAAPPLVQEKKRRKEEEEEEEGEEEERRSGNRYFVPTYVLYPCANAASCLSVGDSATRRLSVPAGGPRDV